MKFRYREPHEMKDSWVEWLGMIPKEWEVKPHKHIMSKKKIICNTHNGENILSLTKNGVIVRDIENPFGKMPTTFDGYQKVEKDNLLLCLFDIDVTPRCVGLIKDNGLTSPAYSQFALKNGNWAPYYDYLLRKIDDEKCFLHLSKNLRNSLTEDNFGIINTIQPIINEQQKIATFLDQKTSEFDNIIVKKQAFIDKLTEAKKSLISEVVTGKKKVQVESNKYKVINRKAEDMKDSGVEWLGMIPKEWEVKRLKNVIEFNPKKSEVNHLQSLNCSFIPMEKLRTGNMDLEYKKKIEEVYSGYTYFKDDDIVMAKVTPCFENKNIAIAKNLENGIGFGSSELYVFRKKKNTNTKYVYYFLQEERFIKLTTSQMTGAGGLKRVPSEFLIDFKLMFPNIQEQQLIVEFLDEKTAKIDNTIEKIKVQIEKLKEAKQSLISEAVTGKIEVM